jgi:hypothetical protein
VREPARARRVPGTGRGLTAMPPTFQAIPIFGIIAKGYRLMRPGIELAPWNARVMEVIGNRLRFNEPVEQGAAP